jgi:predicted transcriptional regulator
LTLNEFGELNQSQLMSYCRLNNVEHKPMLDELVEKELIIRFEEPWGEQNRIIKYRISEKGRKIAKTIFEPYELLFPRSEDKKK